MGRWQANPLNNMSSKACMGCFHLEEENYWNEAPLDQI